MFIVMDTVDDVCSSDWEHKEEEGEQEEDISYEFHSSVIFLFYYVLLYFFHFNIM